MANPTSDPGPSPRLESERPEKADRTRLQLEFTPSSMRRLEEIRQKSDARSNAEVVRAALRLYEWFLEQQRDNAKIFVGRGNDIREVEFLFDR